MRRGRVARVEAAEEVREGHGDVALLVRGNELVLRVDKVRQVVVVARGERVAQLAAAVGGEHVRKVDGVGLGARVAALALAALLALVAARAGVRARAGLGGALQAVESVAHGVRGAVLEEGGDDHPLVPVVAHALADDQVLGRRPRAVLHVGVLVARDGVLGGGVGRGCGRRGGRRRRVVAPGRRRGGARRVGGVRSARARGHVLVGCSAILVSGGLALGVEEREGEVRLGLAHLAARGDEGVARLGDLLVETVQLRARERRGHAGRGGEHGRRRRRVVVAEALAGGAEELLHARGELVCGVLHHG
mmetsp:Transcript_10835/g.36767  ORF Transcript_10835/g.36767 Transcript_10835/m.36767 type:complete len:306 (-) Transcript_10835:99-1016(-)